MESGIGKIPNSLKLEHLKPGVSPIMVCVGSERNFEFFREGSIQEKFSEKNGERYYVNYYEPARLLNEKGFLNSGNKTYVISKIDSLDKFSQDFQDCTSLIATGKEKSTGKNISFLTHQDPTRFLYHHKVDFLYHLRQCLKELKERSEPGTIDAIIVGGKISKGGYFGVDFERNYLESIKLISEEVAKGLNFEPIVFNGPKLDSIDPDDVFFENNTRRLYLVRESLNSDIHSFNQTGIGKIKRKIK
jgi:hypothetical protein